MVVLDLRAMVTIPSTPPFQFEARRRQLAARLAQLGCTVPCVFPAGWARPRNFAHNHFPFRAESHFLHLVGHHIEGAVLVLAHDGKATVYVEPADPEAALWEGEATSLEKWSATLELEVQPLVHLEIKDCAAMPPQDEATAAWLSELLDVDIFAQSGAELQGAGALLANVMVEERLIKDEPALAQMAAVAEISAQAHVLGMRAAQLATRESEIRAAIESHFIRYGLSGAYTSIVTTHGEILHAERSDGLIKPGDLMLCDVGAESREGFAADITRTWPVSGKFSPTQRVVYQAVLDVQKRAIARALPGIHYAELHRLAVSDMCEALLEIGILQGPIEDCLALGVASVFFPHGLGHLLGLDVHDMEDLGDRAGYDEQSQRSCDPVLRFLRLSRVLTENMVVTIEPGFYQVPFLLKRARAERDLSVHIDWDRLAEFADVRGIRIEDDVVIKAERPWVLSATAPKEIEEIENLMSAPSSM